MAEIIVRPEIARVEELLARYEQQIGADLAGYRNHVYRCVTYAMHFLKDDLEHRPIVETAFVYHDIGLWTNRELAYLEPSEALALEDNDKFGWGLDAQALRDVIHWHHKLFRYQGANEALVEACRKADWIDATKGWLRKGMAKSDIAKVEATFPNNGFHKTLMRLAKEYGGSTLVGGFKVTRGILKW